MCRDLDQKGAFCVGKGSEENHDIPGSGDMADSPRDGYPTRSLPDSSVEIGTQIGRYSFSASWARAVSE